VVGDDEPQQSNGYLNFDTPGGYTINTNQRAAIAHGNAEALLGMSGQ